MKLQYQPQFISKNRDNLASKFKNLALAIANPLEVTFEKQVSGNGVTHVLVLVGEGAKFRLRAGHSYSTLPEHLQEDLVTQVKSDEFKCEMLNQLYAEYSFLQQDFLHLDANFINLILRNYR